LTRAAQPKVRLVISVVSGLLILNPNAC
jgi:hypothetical protein